MLAHLDFGIVGVKYFCLLLSCSFADCRFLARFVQQLQGVGIGDDTTSSSQPCCLPSAKCASRNRAPFSVGEEIDTWNQVIRRGFTICVLIEVVWPLNFFACRQFGHFKVQLCDFASRKRPRRCRPCSYTFPVSTSWLSFTKLESTTERKVPVSSSVRSTCVFPLGLRTSTTISVVSRLLISLFELIRTRFAQNGKIGFYFAILVWLVAIWVARTFYPLLRSLLLLKETSFILFFSLCLPFCCLSLTWLCLLLPFALVWPFFGISQKAPTFS